jgi:hypothetical protein
MTASPRNQVLCKQCGLTLGRVAPRKSGLPLQITLMPRVALLVMPGRVDVFCPACGHVRSVDLHRYRVAREKAA